MKAPSERAQAILARYKAAQAPPPATKAQVLEIVRERALRGDLPRFEHACDHVKNNGLPQIARMNADARRL